MQKIIGNFGLFLILGFILVAIAQPAYANHPPSATERAVLLARIDTLLQQIQTLQELIAVREAEKTSLTVRAATDTDDFEVVHTHFFGTDFEAIYEVDSRLNLIRRDIQTGTRITDLRLWDLFVDTVGRNEAKRYIDEFRVYDKASTNIAAFVELRRSSQTGDYWILGVNEDDFNSRDTATRRSFSVLFVHELAHLILEDKNDIKEDFEAEFWTRDNLRHAARMENYEGQQLDDALEDYYEDNEDDFVSDYATYNSDEDFAETFTYFVINDKPKSNDLWAEKVEFMYNYDRLTDVRDEVRQNLDL